MKLQGLGIIFVMIVLPMILVLSYYLQLQIDTITLQTSYDNKLINATYDAMAAFEMNTANEDLSSVSDSLRSIINASTATFTNTLATNLGLSNASKERIQEYIPAILYTLYDGYYIYAPTEVPIIKEKTTTNGDIITSEGAAIVGEEAVGDDGPGYYTNDGTTSAELPDDANAYGSLLYEQENGTYDIRIDPDNMNTDYVLKSYMPYSATYSDGSDDNKVTINYTLDNFLSISGIIDGIYYTKSGYYINTAIISPPSIPNWDNMGQDQVKEYCMSGESITISINGEDISYIGVYDVSGNPISIEERETELKILGDESNPATYDLPEYRNLKANIDNLKAITYYLTNYKFSEWLNSGKLDFVTGANLINTNNDIVTPDDNITIYHNFTSDGQIFGIDPDPESDDSIFINHKYNVIKNSIQYNLNLAISSYSEKYQLLEFRMPQLTDSEWAKITSKVSIATFMQGVDCGTKNYNGYAVVSSTNNELTVIPEEIYYVKKDEFNDNNPLNTYYYHRLDCNLLNDNGTYMGDYISFKSKEVKYDKIKDGDSILYDHKNLGCYNCIIQRNYQNIVDNDGDGASDAYTVNEFIDHPTTDTNLKRAYYIAVGKERQKLYKTIAYSKNEGIEIDNNPSTKGTVTFSGDRIKAEITIEIINTEGVVKDLQVGSDIIGKISTATKSKQTIKIEKIYFSGGTISIPNRAIDGLPVFQVLSIKYIYK